VGRISLGLLTNQQGSVHCFAEDSHTYYYDDPGLPAYINKNTGQTTNASDPNGAPCQGQKGWMDIAAGGPGDTVLWRMRDHQVSGIWLIHEHLHVNEWSSDSNLHKKWEAYRRANTSQAYCRIALSAHLLD
jgi:hypothetical protein